MENKEYEQSEVNLVTSAADLVVGIATGVSPIGTASSLVQFFINRKEQVHRKVFAAFLSANGTAEEVKAFLLKCDSDEEYSRNFSEWLLDILGELDDEHVTASMRAKLQDKQRKASFKAYRRLTNGTSNEIDVFFKYFGNFFCFMLFCVFKTVICNANISRKR